MQKVIILLLITNFVIQSDTATNFTKLLEELTEQPDYFMPNYSSERNPRVRNEDIYLNVTQLITKYKYPAEEHTVETSDGYLLKVIRMRNDKGPVVLVMHGFLSSADDFVTIGPEMGLPYLLHNQGYDVWLGNARGNKYSRSHVFLSRDSAEFWNFTWNEIGLYDLPAMINYALNTTGQSDLVYIGHSQGTTSFFVMCSEINCTSVSIMIALAPATSLGNVKTPLVRLLAPYADKIHTFSQIMGLYELFPSDPMMKILSVICADVETAVLICSNFGFTLFGFDYGQINITNAPVFYGHLPAGTSVKTLVHYLQTVNTGSFRKFDYGDKNIEIYESEEPPAYNLTRITVPVALYYGENDWLAVYDDIEPLIHTLPRIERIYKVPYSKFNHMDFLWAKDVKTLLYDNVVELIQNNVGFN